MLHGFTLIAVMKAASKGLRPRGHRPVEMYFDVCLQQNVYAGWGIWLKDISRGSQKIARIAKTGNRRN
jgi:hypothetical protein